MHVCSMVCHPLTSLHRRSSASSSIERCSACDATTREVRSTADTGHSTSSSTAAAAMPMLLRVAGSISGTSIRIIVHRAHKNCATQFSFVRRCMRATQHSSATGPRHISRYATAHNPLRFRLLCGHHHVISTMMSTCDLAHYWGDAAFPTMMIPLSLYKLPSSTIMHLPRLVRMAHAHHPHNTSTGVPCTAQPRTDSRPSDHTS
jgi:hypothetical protein